MDVSKYHTRFPPKEHEEAVRMLLDGLEKQAPQSDIKEATLTRRKREQQQTLSTGATSGHRTNSSLHHQEDIEPHLASNRRQLATSTNMNRKSEHAPKTNNNYASSKSSSVDSGSLARGPEDEDEFELTNSQRATTKHEQDSNQLEFTSEESSSQDFIQVSPQIPTKRLHGSRKPSVDYEQMLVRVPKMQSKATSTASDSISTSGTSGTGRAEGQKHDHHDDGDMNGNYEAIPSRTIAIQCDLKLSSVKRDGYLDSASSDLASMQASSISSTRYGFYKLSPETLEQRRQLARSVSSRNIAHAGLVRAPEGVAEAPTSMSELSSVSDVEEFDPELDRIRRQSTTTAEPSIASSDFAPDVVKSNRGRRFFSQRQRQQQVSSKSRLNSLPRRPKTALSYVSNRKLRGQQQQQESGELTPENSLSDHELHSHDDLQTERALARKMSPRDRAVSQQVLSTSAGATRQPSRRGGIISEQLASGNYVSSNSDSDVGGTERYRVPHQEEVVVTKRGRTLVASPQVSRSQNIRNGPMFRRSATLGNSNTANLSRGAHYRDEQQELNEEDIIEEDHLPMEYRQTSYQQRVKKLPSASYTSDEGNQLAAERRRAAARIERQSGGSHYNLMTLSRGLPQQQIIDECGSCKLIAPPPTTTTTLTGDDNIKANQLTTTSASSNMPDGLHESTHDSHTNTNTNTNTNNNNNNTNNTRQSLSSRPQLARKERSFSQQTLPTTLRTIPKSSLAPTAPSLQAQVGRSTSMKQGRTRLLANSGGHTRQSMHRQLDEHELDGHQQQSVYTTPASQHGPSQSNRHKRYHDTNNHCEYEDCCGPEMDAHTELLAKQQSDQQVDEDEFEQHQQLSGLASQHNGTATTKRSESEDSESPLTRTWANPDSARLLSSKPHHRSSSNFTKQHTKNASTNEHLRARQLPGQTLASGKNGRSLTRKSARSHSMRDVNSMEPAEVLTNSTMLNGGQRPKRFESIYRAGQQEEDNDEHNEYAFEGHHQEDIPSEEFSFCSTSSVDVGGPEALTRAQAHHRPLDFDSQQRLNEIGLPEANHSISGGSSTTKRPMTTSASHLGLSTALSGALLNRYATTGRSTGAGAGAGATQHYQFHDGTHRRGPAITGRAMSQQSLTRPTMPLSRRLRRSGAGSGSDVGGSSMSLVGRLRDGSRYENAHTRSPVVMLIPQAPSKTDLTRSGTVSRKGGSRLGRPMSRSSGSRVSSQDRTRRSLSRNGSDSESSSSMLRTLVKPRSNRVATGNQNRSTRRRGTTGANHRNSDEEENLDEIGQLATEIDSYKFRRRYSVPKDAKINWFSKLKQRVISSKS